MRFFLSLLLAGFLSFNFAFPAITFAAQDANTVVIQNSSFNPTQIQVSPGTTVTWVNYDNTAHTSTSDSNSLESWNSGQIQPGQSYSHTFNNAGTFSYHCAIHPNMIATVIVTTNPQVTGSSSTTVIELPKTGPPLISFILIGLAPLAYFLIKAKPASKKAANDFWLERQFKR